MVFFFPGASYENTAIKYGDRTRYEFDNTLKEAAMIPDFYRGGAKRFSDLGYNADFKELHSAVWNDDVFYIWDNLESPDMVFIPDSNKSVNDYGDYTTTDGIINFFEEYELKTGKKVGKSFYLTENYQVVMIYKIDNKLYLHQFN